MSDTDDPYGSSPSSPPPAPGPAQGWGAPPPPYGGPPVHVDNHMTLAIIATVAGLFCGCLGVIPGIVALVQASNVDKRLREGNIAAAQNAASQARGWAIAGIVLGGIGVVFTVLWFLLVFAGAASSSFNT